MDKLKRSELRTKIATAEQLSETCKSEAGLMTPYNRTNFEEDTLFRIVPLLLGQVDALEIALCDAIRRPMGVIPESAEKFITAKDLSEAESRRMSSDLSQWYNS